MDEPVTESAAGRIARLLPYLDAFVGFVRKRVGDPSLADDLVQDALAKAMVHVQDVRDDELMEAWFYRVLRNMIADLHAKKSRSAALMDAETLAADPEDHAIACKCLGDLIAELEPPYRDAVQFVDVDGLSATQAAQRLGITETNLKVRRHRAREQLREMLSVTCRMCFLHGCLDCHCRRSER